LKEAENNKKEELQNDYISQEEKGKKIKKMKITKIKLN